MTEKQTDKNKKGVVHFIITSAILGVAIIAYMQHMTARIVSKHTEINNTLYTEILAEFDRNPSAQKTATLLRINHNGITAQEYRDFFRGTGKHINAVLSAKMFKRHDPQDTEEAAQRAIIVQRFDAIEQQFLSQEVKHNSYVTLLGVTQTKPEANADIQTALSDNIITLSEFIALKAHHNVEITYSYFNETDPDDNHDDVKRLIQQQLNNT